MTEPTGTGTAKQMFVDTYKPHRIGLHSDDKPYIGEPLCYCDKPNKPKMRICTIGCFLDVFGGDL